MLTWMFMIFTSMAYPVCATLALWGGGFLARRAGWNLPRRYLVPAAPLLVLVLATAANLALPTTPPPRAADTTLRLVHLNAFWYNHAIPVARLGFVSQSQADIIVLNEVNDELASQLVQNPVLPYRHFSSSTVPSFHLGMALLSRWPVEHLQAFGPRLHLYRIARPDGPLHVLHIHPQSPYTPKALAYRNHELATLQQQNLPSPLVIAGDLNTVPWDTAMASWRRRYHMAGSWWPTHPNPLPLAPIDLVLTSHDLPAPRVSRVRVAGTDHLGLVADFR